MSKKPETDFNKEVKRRARRENNHGGFKLGHELGIPLWIAFCVGIAWVYSSWVRQGNADVTSVNSSSETVNSIREHYNSFKQLEPVPPEPVPPEPVELPPTGVLQAAEFIDEWEVAQLRVFLRAPVADDESSLSQTCSGSESIWQAEQHRFLQVVDWDSNTIIATAFVRAGEMVEIPLPYGSYKLRFAVGTEWYGEKEMFGSQYIYEMTERFSSEAAKFRFSKFTPGSDLGSYCPNGNLGKKRIKNDALPAHNQTI